MIPDQGERDLVEHGLGEVAMEAREASWLGIGEGWTRAAEFRRRLVSTLFAAVRKKEKGRSERNGASRCG